jgi:glutamate---cysteine ligase / carboxylate-amine ligase
MARVLQTVRVRTVGVEEEFWLVDACLDRLAPVASRVLRLAAEQGEDPGPGGGTDGGAGGVVRGALVHEFWEEQLEAFTSPHSSMTALAGELRSRRAAAAAAAVEAGARLVATATPSVAAVGIPHHVRSERYDRIAARVGFVTRELLTCGCHVHVSVASPGEAVGVLDRIRVWLPVLLALSANSPFWQGHDTGYASYRNQVMGRWPVSGPTEVFGSVERCREVVDDLVATEVVLDPGMLYFDARASHRYPTVEVRMPDTCLDVRDAVLMAALARALVDTSAEEWTSHEPPPATPAALLRLATWQAAQRGMEDRLLDPLTSRPRPAEEVVARLLDHLRPALARNRDSSLVDQGIDRILTLGTGATRQRRLLAGTGRLTDVVAALVRVTAAQDG